MDAIQDGHAVNRQGSEVCAAADAIRQAQKDKASDPEGLTGFLFPALLSRRFLLS
jgi:hypothetical protein